MKKQIIKASHIILAVALSLVMSCSSSRTYPEYKDDIDRDKVKSLFECYASYASHESTLLTPADSTCFIFDTKALTFINPEECNAIDIRSPEYIILFRITDQLRSIYWFDPVKAEIQTKSIRPHDTFTLYRSQAEDHTLPLETEHLQLHRYAFIISDTSIEFESTQQITDEDEQSSYLPLQSGTSVYFLQFNNEAPPQLMMIGESGAVYPVLATSGYEVHSIRKGQNNSIILWARTSNTESLKAYRLRQNETTLIPLDRLEDRLPERCRYTMYQSQESAPQLMSLPETIVPSQLIDLVVARNPLVNKKRTDLAAALLTAEIARLDKYPSLSFALYYTPQVGVFTDEPDVASGDFLSEGIARGMIGLVQNITDFSKIDARHKAAIQRAEMMNYYLEDEINSRVAEALQTYKEIQYYRELQKLTDKQIANEKKRLNYYQQNKSVGNALDANLMSASKNETSFTSLQHFYGDRISYLTNKLWKLCGVSKSRAPDIIDEDYNFYYYNRKDTTKLIRESQMNHPKVLIADYALNEQYFIQQGGYKGAPSVSVGAFYSQSRDQFTSLVDDYISLSLTGTAPLMFNKMRDLHSEYGETSLAGLKYTRQHIIDQIALDAEEALMDYRAAIRDYGAKRSDEEYFAELYRLSLLKQEFGSADSTERVSADEPFAAMSEYLQARERSAKSRFDYQQRYFNVCRQLGIYREILHSKASSQPSINSVWLWETDKVIFSGKELQLFIKTANTFKIDRVYMYCEPALFKSRLRVHHITRFIDTCTRFDIDVWALLAEPEWLDDKNSHADMTNLITEIHNYNDKERNGILSGFKGIKVDSEPHSDPRWDSDKEFKEARSAAYEQVLSTSNTSNDQRLPLFVDIPYKYYSQNESSLLDAIDTATTGTTVMCYNRNPESVLSMVRKVSEDSTRAVEIGIELNSKAPRTDTMSGISKEKLEGLIRKIKQIDPTKILGVSFHDYMALREYMKHEELIHHENKIYKSTKR